MSLILHLSDLHLGSPDASQRDYEDKTGLGDVPGDTDIDHLERTLAALGSELSEEDRRLDAVVVTGDLTKRNCPDGYEAFAGVLDQLGSARPADDRIIVVPGNHDVDAALPPGDHHRLKRFLDATRPRYRTPLVKGLDYSDSEKRRNPGSRGRPYPVLELEDAVIVGINSADYCQTRESGTETAWEDVLADYLAAELAEPGGDGETGRAAAKRAVAEQELAMLRTFDIPKVDKRQIAALEDRLNACDVLSDNADGDPRLRIAALHHPIGISSNQEEIKPFEAITNLAALRTFLYHRGFHLILHGHKHRSYAAWDWLLQPGDDLDVVPWRALVLGSSGRFGIGEPVCRLIETCPDGTAPVAGAPRLRAIDVKGIAPSEHLSLEFSKAPVRSLAQPFISSTNPDTPWVVKARTADAVYQQLCDLPVQAGVNRPVVSVVEDAESTNQFPTNYKQRDGTALEDLVEWWQHRRPEAVQSYSGSEFNHGERLYGDRDAIAAAVEALPSSKAIALLVRPEEAGDKGREFPAFSEVQLQVRSAPGGGTLLDVVGVYRKQDLDLWWPVNMAELAHIQRRAVGVAKDRSTVAKPVTAGRLIAMATLGVHDDVLPQMAGTTLDRAVDLRPEWIYRLAYLAAHPGPSSVPEWERALGDIGGRPGGAPLVPSVGISRLRDALRTHSSGTTDAKFRKLLRTVEELADRARQAAVNLRGNEPSQTTLDDWGRQLKDLALECEKALKAVVRAPKNADKG